jgi:hypothetical protein
MAATTVVVGLGGVGSYCFFFYSSCCLLFSVASGTAVVLGVYDVASPVVRVVEAVGTVVVYRGWPVAVLVVAVMKKNYSKLL